MNFYKHYLGDYARDTADLSILEHGAYRVLLDHYYAQLGIVPADLEKLYRVCRAHSAADRRAVSEIAERFFPVNGDGRRHNRRADEEIQKHAGQAEANRLVAEERERKRREHKSLDDPSDEQSTNRSTIGSPNHSQKPEESKASDAPHRKAATLSQPIPDCPQEKLKDLYHELLPMCTRIEKWTPARQTVMRARWRDEAQPNREKHRGYSTVEDGLAYWRRFFAWCSESKFLTGNAPGRDGAPPFVASLPWLLKAENFAKAIEGNYHR